MKRSKQEVEKLREVILKYKSEVYHHGSVTGKGFDVWKNISADLGGIMSSTALYTCVMKNYHNILDLLTSANEDENEESSEKGSTEDSATSESPRKMSESDRSSSSTGERITFDILITKEDYIRMSPVEKSYKCNEKSKKTTIRKYTVFQPGAWTHIIHDYFSKSSKCSCVLAFKAAKILKSGKYFASISGRCVECSSIFNGIIKSKPNLGEEVVVKCYLKGEFRSEHSSHSKRKLSGIKRKKAVEDMVEKKMAPNLVRRLQAHESMEFGEPEPSDLPSANVLRVAKSQAMKKTYLDDDPFRAVCKMIDIVPFQAVIRELAFYKFRVIYWLPTQMHVYRSYYEKFPNDAKLSIDATGSLVRKLERNKNKSGNIFLYEATVNDSQKKQQYAVTQMLSEAHDSNSIFNWLLLWRDSGAPAPKEVVTDMSHALLNAVARAFTSCKSLADYINRVANVIFNGKIQDVPECYIRCDVAHTVKLISRWKCLRLKNITGGTRTRQFYLRAMGQALQSESIEELKRFFLAIVTVALSETEGTNDETGLETKCETRKSWLKAKTSGTTSQEDLDKLISTFNDETTGDPNDWGYDTETLRGSPFDQWLKDIIENCSEELNDPQEEGNRGNQQVLPVLVKDLTTMSRLIPLWTAIMRPTFNRGSIVASSAPVESNFNDLKNRIFAHEKLPIRLDVFLKAHIMALDGGLKLVEASRQEKDEISITSEPAADSANLSQEESSSFTVTTRCIYCEKTDCVENHLEFLEEKTSNQISENNDTIIYPSCEECAVKNFPGDVYKCKYCNINVHLFPGCSLPIEGENDDYEPLRMCVICSKKTVAERTNAEERSEVENWMDLGREVTKKPRSRKSYLDQCPEMGRIDFAKSHAVRIIGLLKNANLKSLQALKIKKTRYSISNTCAFDAFIQSLCISYCDSNAMKVLIDESELTIFTFVKNMMDKGVTSALYRERTKILISIFAEGEDYPFNLKRIRCEVAIGELIKLTDIGRSGSYEINSCDNGACPRKPSTIYRPITSIDCPSLSNEVLEDKIKEYFSDIKYVFCQGPPPNGCDKGNRSFKVTQSQNYLFVEPTNFALRLDCETTANTQLREIPKTLKLEDGVNFHLRAVLAFRGENVQSLVAMGHYICYGYRSNEKFEIYDDLQKEVTDVSDKQKVSIHLLHYSI